MTRRIAHAAPIAALALAFALAPIALASKPSSGSTSFSLVMVSDANGDGLPNYADTVTFDVSTTATDSPRVQVDCYQNGAHVYWRSAAWYDGNPWPWLKNFTLSSDYWRSGAADCTAELRATLHRKEVVLATLTFRADA